MDNREPQSGTTTAAPRGVERLENALQLLGGDPLAIVADTYFNLTRAPAGVVDAHFSAGACCRFNEDSRVMIVRADSGLFMQMASNLDLPPALFWLDAHYPGAGFGLKDYGDAMPETIRLPLGRELEQIRRNRAGLDVIIIDDLRIYETGDWEDGPLPEGTPGEPAENGADWIRYLFSETHTAHTIIRDQGYLLLLPKG